MKVTRDFMVNGDRYVFDFKLCPVREGWAQVDTSQDASYFGTWANAARRTIVSYCEGDVTIQQAESAEEFVEAIREMAEWNREAGYSFAIDGMCNDDTIRAFEAAGLGEYLH